MERLGRQRKFKYMPQWLRTRIEVNWFESLRLMEQARQQIPAGARVLDAGSGEGRYKEYFTHTRYVGLDLAVGDVTWDYSDLDAIGDLCEIPFPDNTFDAAVCIQTLEHVNNPFRVISEIGRVLKPGGRFYLAAPMTWHQHQKPHDFFRYTSFGFEHLLQQAGMHIVEIRPVGGYFWLLSHQLQMLHDYLFPRWEKPWQWWLQLPYQILTQALFFILVPVILFYLDRLDKVKNHTIGWACIAEKTGATDYK
ncbi:MAG: methyltransferase domain-containing protein [Candidatus Promineifilaceae bacterium]|nr:methyltransferase domain-containing protein [Candidatus Promineifilaceae bacterium]